MVPAGYRLEKELPCCDTDVHRQNHHCQTEHLRAASRCPFRHSEPAFPRAHALILSGNTSHPHHTRALGACAPETCSPVQPVHPVLPHSILQSIPPSKATSSLGTCLHIYLPLRPCASLLPWQPSVPRPRLLSLCS